jgi:hypothetical protein
MKHFEFPPALEREWQQQENARNEERLALRPERFTATGRQYIAISHALRAPLDRELDDDFARVVALRAQTKVPSHLIRAGALENILLWGPIALLGISLVWMMWDLAKGDGLTATVAFVESLLESWAGVAVVCVVFWPTAARFWRWMASTICRTPV